MTNRRFSSTGIAGIAIVAIGIAMISVAVPSLFANPAFTAFNYEEDNMDVNLMLQILSAGALILGIGAILLFKGIKIKKAV